VSTAPPDRPPVGRLLAVLRVRRNVLVGLAVGAALAAGLYAVRVLEFLGPAPERGSPLLFAGLALVLALSAGALVATLLTLVTAVLVARRAGDQPGRAEDR
jgi:fucose permease